MYNIRPSVRLHNTESYALKQQGHYHDVATSVFSPDGLNLVTGADDPKVASDDL